MIGFFHLLEMFFITAVAGWRERFWSQEKIRRLQARKLQKIISYAKKNVPYYSRTLKDVDPNHFRLADMPTFNKRELIANLADTLSIRGVTRDEIVEFSKDPQQIGKFFRDRYVLCTTSGTTGIVGYFLSTKSCWSKLRGVEFARLLRGRLSAGHIYKYAIRQKLRWAMLVATGGHYITYLLMKLTPRAAGLMSDVRPFSIMDPIHRMVAGLNDFQPHYMHGYPTFLEALAYEQMAGRLDIHPDFISAGSEPFTQTARHILMRAFPGVQLSETYGTTEVLSIANQCPHGRLHINDDYVMVEAVDHENRPVQDGVRSRKALVTSLNNFLQPLIRYEMTDSIVIHPPGACTCGSPLRVIEVHGRSDDTFFLRDAEGHFHAFPPIPFEVLFLRINGLRQYQLIHEEQNHLRIRYARMESCPSEKVEAQLREQFGGYFESCGIKATVTLSLEEMGEITRPPSTQKVRQIFSRVKPPNRIR
jgi:phenylacetate-coenzyme A ligase PaaK-like adenylate-forming protein